MTYQDEVLADAPVAYWRLNEASGAFGDLTGNGHTITEVNGPTVRGAEPGPFGDDELPVTLNGVNQRFDSDVLFYDVSAATVEFWWKGTDTTALIADARPGSPSWARSFSTWLGSAPVGTQPGPGRLAYGMSGNGTWLGVAATAGVGAPAVNDDEWHHIVLVLRTPAPGTEPSASTFSGYVDGNLIPQEPSVYGGSAQPPHYGTLWSFFGSGRVEDGGFLSGAVSNLAVYHTPLTADRVSAHYTAAFSSSDLLAAGSATSHADVVGRVVMNTVLARAAGSASSHANVVARGVATAVTSNRVGGRWRNASGTAEWSPPVVIPDEYQPGRDVAIAFTQPVIDPATGRVAYNAQKAEKVHHLDRIIVGGKDVTQWRGVMTPLPAHTLVEPLGYGPATLTLPQAHAAFERPGYGQLKFLRAGSTVVLERVDPETGVVVARDYKGVIVSQDHSGRAMSFQVGGEASGRAALRDKTVPIFFWKMDLGRMAHDAIVGLGLPFSPYLGPVTGIRQQRFGGMGHLDYIQQICRTAWTRAQNQWVVMPDTSLTGGGVYRMEQKDTTTIHGTVYLDDERSVGDLSRDISEEPNRVYMTGVTPEGLRVRFGAYPGLKHTPPPRYPFNDGRDFGQGTEDADTDTGDGITVMVNRLFITKYLTRAQIPGGYDGAVRRAIRDLQDDAGLDVTGIMTKRTWRVLYDLQTTGYSLRESEIQPAAQRPAVRPWNLSPSGARISRNRRYDRKVIKVDRSVDAGAGFEREQLREWASAEIDAGAEPNYVGSISFNTGALISGQHDPGDLLDPARVMSARDLRPGMNLWLPLFAGGILVHVAAVNITAGSGAVSVDVDTRARDAMELWEVIARNRESRRSVKRAWIEANRSSTEQKDSTGVWDEVGGVLGDTIDVPGNRWVVFPVVAGQSGTIRSLRVDTSPNAEFVMAVFGKRIGPGRLRRLVGNPLTRKGAKRWEREDVRDTLDQNNWVLYIAGTNDEPLGYFPKTKTKRGDDDVTPAPLTGRWSDDAGFPYYASPTQVLWVAVWADRDTKIPRGRIMWPTLESGT